MQTNSTDPNGKCDDVGDGIPQPLPKGVRYLAIAFLCFVGLYFLTALLINIVSRTIADGRMERTSPYEAVERCTEAELYLILTKYGHDANELNAEGESAIFAAIRQSNLSVMAILLRLGARTDIVNKAGESPYTLAAKQSESALIKSLLDTRAEGAEFDAWVPQPLRSKK